MFDRCNTLFQNVRRVAGECCGAPFSWFFADDVSTRESDDVSTKWRPDDVSRKRELCPPRRMFEDVKFFSELSFSLSLFCF